MTRIKGKDYLRSTTIPSFSELETNAANIRQVEALNLLLHQFVWLHMGIQFGGFNRT